MIAEALYCDSIRTMPRPRVFAGVIDTQAGRRAVRAGFNAARLMQADLFLITCFEESGSGELDERSSFDAALREQARVVVEELGPARWTVCAFCDAVPGDPADVLVRLSFDADLLVVGSGGELQPNSPVVTTCLRWAPCEVLIA